MKNHKNKIIKIAIIACFLISALILSGCANNSGKASTLDLIINNMSKITNTLDNVKTIDNSELIINDFMNERELSSVNAMYSSNQFTTNAMNSYFSKITTLNNCVISTISVNTEIDEIKKQIYAKTTFVKSLCKQNKESEAQFNNDTINTLKQLNGTIMANNTARR